MYSHLFAYSKPNVLLFLQLYTLRGLSHSLTDSSGRVACTLKYSILSTMEEIIE